MSPPNPNYSLNLNSILPRMNNSEMIYITEIDNTTMTRETNFTSENFEDYILYNLAQNNSAYDISINENTVPVDLSYQDTSVTIKHPEPNNLKNHVVINNSDDFITSEKFAMNLTYNQSKTLPKYTDKYVIVGRNSRINSNISLKSDTISYYDSNLKLNITLNADEQYTTDSEWQVEFDRQYNNMNYFAAINSHLNSATPNSYPFSIVEDMSNNPYSLFQDGFYFEGGEQSDSTQTSTYLKQRTLKKFSDINLSTLADVNLAATLNQNYTYTGDEDVFKTYKIVQNVDPSNSLTFLLRDDNENFYYNTGANFSVGVYNDASGNYGSADLYEGLIDLSNVFSTVNLFDPSNSQRINDGFTATLTIGGKKRGGYIDPSAGSNPLFVLDQSSLTTTGSPENINYFNNHKPLGIHRVDIVNGEVVVDTENGLNGQFISVSSGAETLDASFNTTYGSVHLQSGAIVTRDIELKPSMKNGITHFDSSGRVSFNYILDLSENVSGSLNPDFTDSVAVYYNHFESLNTKSSLSEDDDLCTTDFVQYDLKLLIESTDSTSNDNTYSQSKDARNICSNNINKFGDFPDSRLVMATDTQPNGFDLESTTFIFGNTDTNARIRANGKVNIFNIKNQDKLVESGSLYYYNNKQDEIAEENKQNIDGSFCTVTFESYKISELPYVDYQVVLETKTSTDISNSVRATNGWGFTTILGPSNEYLIGNPMRPSELFQDDSKFISKPDKDELPINYKFYIQNSNENGVSTCRSLNSIKYCFDVSLTDPTADSNYNPISQYKFGGNTDISFITQKEFTDVKLADISYGYIGDIPGKDKTKYIYQKWLRRKQYIALINPSLPFYENLLLKTKTIYEEQIFYRIWNKLPSGNQGTEIFNKSSFLFSINNNIEPMNNVYAKLVSSFGHLYCNETSSCALTNISTTITLHPEDCCIFKTYLEGRDISGGEWTKLGFDVSNQVWKPQFTPISLDPFIESEGTISVLGIATCKVQVNVPQARIINKKQYYISISNKLGDNNAFSAELYLFSLDDLVESGLDNNFNPYLSDFTAVSKYKSGQKYDCDLSNNGPDNYILTVTHNNNGVKHTDLQITYNKDYVLSFNVINSPYNLIEVKRTLGNEIKKSYVFETNQTDKFEAQIDYGVYFRHIQDLTFGLRESFILNPDRVHVKFVNDTEDFIYPNNHPYWGAVDKNGNDIYHDISMNNGANIIVNSNQTNGTKNVILHRVRGYQFSNNSQNVPLSAETTLVRTPLTATFTLDVSFAYVTRFIPPSYNGPYLIPGTGITVIDASSRFIQPDASQNAIDPSYNYTYEKALYKQTYYSGAGPFNINNLISVNEFTNITTKNGSKFALNNKVNADDNKVTLDIGLKLNMQKSILEDVNKGPLTYILSTDAADYTYSYKNPTTSFNGTTPPLIVNGDGSGTLFDGILNKYFDLRSRAIYVEKPVTIILRYSGSCVRVYSQPVYNKQPNQITWEDSDELPTSPFYPEELEGAGISLHPTVRNKSYNISINRTTSNITNFTTYMVCAPPAYNIKFNSITSSTNELPIPDNARSIVSIFVDAKNSSPEYDLWDLTPTHVGNSVLIQPTSELNLLKLKSYDINKPHRFEIKGNNIKLSLFQGLSQPKQVRSVSYYDISQGLITQVYDASLNLDPSNNMDKTYDAAYEYYVFTDSSNTSIDDNIYTGPIDSLTTNGSPGILQAVRTGIKYDVSFSQPINNCDANNYGLNINFKIDNAFLPPVTSYLPLPTSVSTSVAFYEAITRYNNGNYNVYLNKYWLGTVDESIELTDGYNYNYLLSNNSNVRELGFVINQKSQKVICLSVDDVSGIPNKELKFDENYTNYNNEASHDIQQFLDKISPFDLSGLDWDNTELDEPVNIGISFAAYDSLGFTGLQNVFKYDATKRLLNKTLYIERNDIFRVSSFFGQPVFRITNSGNIVTNKVSTSLLSIYEQSENTRDIPEFGPNSNIPGLFSPVGSIPASIVGQNTLDFSGNKWLTSEIYNYTPL